MSNSMVIAYRLIWRYQVPLTTLWGNSERHSYWPSAYLAFSFLWALPGKFVFLSIILYCGCCWYFWYCLCWGFQENAFVTCLAIVKIGFCDCDSYSRKTGEDTGIYIFTLRSQLASDYQSHSLATYRLQCVTSFALRLPAPLCTVATTWLHWTASRYGRIATNNDLRFDKWLRLAGGDWTNWCYATRIFAQRSLNSKIHLHVQTHRDCDNSRCTHDALFDDIRQSLTLTIA